MTEGQAAKINNVLVALQFMLEALDEAEADGIFARKAKQSANRLKGDIEHVFNDVFKGVGVAASGYYVEMLEFLRQQGVVFARVYDYSEQDKTKFLLALQNFYTINLKNPKDAGREEIKKVNR